MSLAPMIDAIMARLADQVPDLAGRIEGAANLAELMRQNKLPQVTPALNVIPSGIGGGKAVAMLNDYRQDVERQYAVILTIRSYEATGGQVQPDAEALIERIIMALVGWTPRTDTRGVFRLVRCFLANMQAGTLAWQIEFSIPDAIRSAA